MANTLEKGIINTSGMLGNVMAVIELIEVLKMKAWSQMKHTKENRHIPPYNEHHRLVCQFITRL